MSLSSKVWSVIISPRDRKLTSRFEMPIDKEIVEFKLYEASDGTKKSSYCTKYYIAQSSANKYVPEYMKKLLVVFPGRNFNFKQRGIHT